MRFNEPTEMNNVIDAMCNVSVTDNEKVEIHTLDYTGNFKRLSEPETNSGKMYEMKVNTQIIDVPEQNYSMTDELLTLAVANNAIRLAAKGANNYEQNLDLDLRDSFNTETGYRRLVTRILMATNIVAMESRQGPADVIMAHTRYIDMLANINGSKGPAMAPPRFGNHKYIAYDACGDRVIVMRKTEHGATMIRHNDNPNRWVFIKSLNEDAAASAHISFTIKY